MEPTLLVGDFVLVEKLAYGTRVPGLDIRIPGYRTPQHGDLVVFNPPRVPRLTYVKRIVGIGGDTLQMQGGILIRNGQAVSEPYAQIDTESSYVAPVFSWQREYLAPGVLAETYQATNLTWGPIIVPEKHYFVLGDNRGHSEDSRYWGFIPDTSIIGRPLIVYFSWESPKGSANGGKIRWTRIGRWLPR